MDITTTTHPDLPPPPEAPDVVSATYEVLDSRLVGHVEGDIVTTEELESLGANVESLITTNIIKAQEANE